MAKKYFDIAKLLGKGVGSLFKGKGKEAAQTTAVETTDNISNVFAKNLVDEFGKDEVREAYRIIDNADKDPQLSKLFYRENESKMDELVNLLESRYMSSERLHAHPLSFNRRGAGAADRYAKINDSGGRLTDLPGGPGDRVLYFKNYGEMSMTKNREGKRVYKNEKPTIFAETPGGKKTKIIKGEVVDEDMVITNQGKMTKKEYEVLKSQDENPLLGGITAGRKIKLLEGDKAVEDSLFKKTIADIPIINRMMKETGKSETEIREAIVRRANEGYEPGSAKRMDIYDDDMIRAHVEVQDATQRSREEFVTDLMEDFIDADTSPGMRKILEQKGFAKPGEGLGSVATRMQNQAKQMQGGTQQLTDMNQRMREFAAKGDFESAEKIKNAVEEYRVAMQKIRAQGLFNQDDLPILIDPTRKPNAAGGRVEMSGGGSSFEEYLKKLREEMKRHPDFYKSAPKDFGPIPIDPGFLVNPFEKKAAGGRVGKFKGGIMGLLRRINPFLERNMVNKGPFQTGHRSDIIGDAQQIKNISRNEGVSLERLDSLYDMVQESPRYNEAMRGAMMKLVDYERFRAILVDDNVKLQRMIKEDPEGSEKFIRMLFREGGSEPQMSQGGRVNMFAGGPLIGKGIMEAAKLAQRGIKPFGAKQTYKQNVTTKGVTDDQFKIIFNDQLRRVPDEVVDQATGEGLNTSLREAEAILTGQKLGLMTQAQRTKLAKAMRDKVAKQIDNPVSGLNNDYLEYMDDALGRMDDLLEIERLGGDLTPKPVKGAPEFIQTDFTQLNRLRDQGKDNIIPFKPRTKKSKGGTLPPLKGPMSDGMGSLFRSK